MEELDLDDLDRIAGGTGITAAVTSHAPAPVQGSHPQTTTILRPIGVAPTTVSAGGFDPQVLLAFLNHGGGPMLAERGSSLSPGAPPQAGFHDLFAGPAAQQGQSFHDDLAAPLHNPLPQQGAPFHDSLSQDEAHFQDPFVHQPMSGGMPSGSLFENTDSMQGSVLSTNPGAATTVNDANYDSFMNSDSSQTTPFSASNGSFSYGHYTEPNTTDALAADAQLDQYQREEHAQTGSQSQSADYDAFMNSDSSFAADFPGEVNTDLGANQI